MSSHHLPLVTIIIPSYNYGRYIADAIESVLGQTYSNIELIIIDDGSQDESVEVIKGYDGIPRVRCYFNTKNAGQGVVLNRAIDLACGDFIGFLPADDWLHPEKIEEQIRKFEALPEKTGVVYCAGNRYFEASRETIEWKLPVYNGKIAEKLITEGNFVYPITPLFRRSVFDKVRFQPGFKAEGEAIYLRVALFFEFEYVPRSLATMRDHDRNVGKEILLMYEENRKYWEWFFSLDYVPDEIKRLKAFALARTERVTGMGLIGDHRRFRDGRRHLQSAFLTYPRMILEAKAAVAYLISYLPPNLANKLIDLVRH